MEVRAALAAYQNHEPAAAARHTTTAVELGRAIPNLRIWGEGLLLQSRASYVGRLWRRPTTEPRDLEAFLEAAQDGRAGTPGAGSHGPFRSWPLLASVLTPRDPTPTKPSASQRRSTTAPQSRGFSSPSVCNGSRRSTSRQQWCRPGAVRNMAFAPVTGSSRHGVSVARHSCIGSREGSPRPRRPRHGPSVMIASKGCGESAR